MCEFVGDDIDMTKLTQAQKDKLKKDLERRKEQLEKRAYELGQAIQKIK
jgi:hypothetical protein